jgi:phosphate acyltransferase
MITVAVDAGGADRGPREVALGAAEAAAKGIGVLLFGPAAEIGEVPDGVQLFDAPVSIAKAADPAFAVRSTPDASIVQAAKAVAEGRAQALVSGGSACSTSSATAASTARHSLCRCRCPAASQSCCSTWAPT